MEEVKANETVKEIPNFSRYLCDIEKGRIYRKATNTRKGTWLKEIKPNAVGYCYTTLINNDNQYERISLQWLVLCAATEHKKEFFTSKSLEIDHRDRNKSNNHINNLHLVHKNQNHENIDNRKKRVRLTYDDIQFMREAFKKWEGKKIEFYKLMSEEFGCVWQTVQYNLLGYNNKEESA